MQIKDAYDYVAHLVYCAINNKTPCPLPDGVTYEQVLSCAVRHDIAGFAYLGVLLATDKPEPDTLGRWKQRYLLGIQRNFEQEKACCDILNGLHDEKIATLELQGTRIKKYYPSPDLRMMGDIDIIVKKDDIFKAEEVLKNLGYETVNQGNYEIDGQKGDIAVEIHTDFFTFNIPFHEIINDPFKDATINDDYTANVSDTVFWTYHLLHCIKHYIGKGIGFRRVLDLFILEPEMRKTADIDSVEKLLEDNGIIDDYKDLFAIAGYLFGNQDTNRKIEDAVSEIKYAGTQGKMDISISHNLKAMRDEGKHFLKLRYFLSQVFPPKRQIYISYPFCEKHHYPYFLACIHRAVCIPFKKGRLKLLKKYIKNILKANAN